MKFSLRDQDRLKFLEFLSFSLYYLSLKTIRIDNLIVNDGKANLRGCFSKGPLLAKVILATS